MTTGQTSRAGARLLNGERVTWLLTVVAVALGSIYPAPGYHLLTEVAAGLASLLPVVAAASLLAGALASGRWSDRVMTAIEGRTPRAVVLASIAGTITPVCGLGILPVIAALLRRGLPLAPVMAFWVSSPIMGPSMVIVTVGVIGVDFALAKALAALAAGLLAGAVTAMVPVGKPGQTMLRDGLDGRQQCAASGFWQEAWLSARLAARWLTLALVMEVMIQRLVPESWIQALFGADNAASVPLAAVVGAPLYIDGYAALPLVRGMMDLGMSFGAALAFMVSGAAVSLYAAVAVAAIVRLRVFFLYVGLAMAAAILSGLAADWLTTPV